VIWLTWRQQRTEALVTTVMLALVGLVLVLTGLHMHSVYGQLGLSGCVSEQAQNTSACGQAIGTFKQRFSSLGTMIGWFNLLPVMIGVLFAAPLLFELEHGTYRLSWTQSITRGRWLTIKIAGAIASVLLATLVLSLLVTWWRGPFDQLDGRIDPNNGFNFEGVAPYAYALFALALTLAIGTISRRLIIAVAGGFAGFLALRLPIQVWLRERLITPVHASWSPLQAAPHNLSQAWVLHSELVSHSRHVTTASGCSAVKQAPSAFCLQKLGFVQSVIYQPANRFWALQGIESAIFVAGAICLLALTAWWIRRRIV
jgi:hypothetical protein